MRRSQDARCATRTSDCGARTAGAAAALLSELGGDDARRARHDARPDRGSCEPGDHDASVRPTSHASTKTCSRAQHKPGSLLDRSLFYDSALLSPCRYSVGRRAGRRTARLGIAATALNVGMLGGLVTARRGVAHLSTTCAIHRLVRWIRGRLPAVTAANKAEEMTKHGHPSIVRRSIGAFKQAATERPVSVG